MSQVPGMPAGAPREGSADVTDVEAPAPPLGDVPEDRTPEPPPPSMPKPPPPKAEETSRPGIIEAVADLLQFVVDWLRQEAGAIMHDKIVIPGQKLGLTLASGCAAALLLSLGLGFISVGLFILLGEWLTYAGALLLTGGVLVLGAVVFTVIKMRSMQK